MAAIFVSTTLAAAGTPQQCSKASSTALPTISMGGVTYPSGSATLRLFQIVAQAAPTNTGSTYIGGPGMNSASLVGVGAVLAPGAALNIGQYGGATTLDDIWWDSATTGNKLLLSLVG